MKLKFIPLILIIFLYIASSQAQELTCQYTQTENYTIQEEIFYHNGEEIGKNLNLSELVKIEQETTIIKITNNLRVPITLNISYHKSSSWFGYNEDVLKIITIKAQDSESIEALPNDCNYFPCRIENLKYYYSEPNIITSEIKTISKERKFCKLCENNEPCLDDNASCNPFYDNLKCGAGICNKRGYCGNDPTITLFENWFFIGLIILVIWAGLYFILRFIHEKKKKKIIIQAKEDAKKILQDARKDLEKINYDIEELKNKKERFEKDLNNLKDKKGEAELIRQNILKINREIGILFNDQIKKREELKKETEKLTRQRLTPFLNKQGHRVYINEEGYEVFARTGTLFHRWWFEHNYKRKIKFGYEIHHKDFNKRNNDIKNLQEVSKEEHRILHLNKYNR